MSAGLLETSIATADRPARPDLSAEPSEGEAPIRVLVVDDEPPLRRAVVRMLMANGMHVVAAEDSSRALSLLETEPFDVALVDLIMPTMGGLELLAVIKRRSPEVEVVMMTAYGDVETAVKAVQAGAYNFLTKPFRSNEEVIHIIRRAAERRNLKAHAERLERQLSASGEGFGALIGSAPIMKEVYRRARDVAATKVTVLILGESGTGKELTARAIHEHSPRKNRPFVAVNCSAIPEGVVESELFGHVKGAFTNATSPRAGLFEAANLGTIFLDEVGDLPPQAQVKLLRVLQEGEVKRVGSNETRVVDVRVVAATNLDLRRKIEAGTFREDLFYRLNVVAINLPPLRERKEDIPALAYHFLQKHAKRVGKETSKISTDAMQLLTSEPWPGNVRELENAIERAVVFCKDTVEPKHLGLSQKSPTAPPVSSDRPLESEEPSSDDGSYEFADLPYREAKEQAMALFERRYFAALRERTLSNVSEAARQAGLDRSNFRRAVKRAGIRWRDDEENAGPSSSRL
jgi:two-component system response regulator HydG